MLTVLASLFIAPGAFRRIGSDSAEVASTQVTSGVDELARIERVLLAAGVDGSRARHAVYGILASEATEGPAYEYWKSPIARDAAERLRDFQRQESVRAKLVEVFGPEAKTDAAFAAAFRPYQRRLPMLSADQQIRLQSLEMEQSKGMAVPGSGPAMAPRSPEAALAGELAADARFEFSLRESGLSRALSSLGFDFTEPEFREVFRALAAAHPNRVALPTAASFAGMLQDEAALKVVRSTLSPQRYEEFERSRDPFFGLMRRIAVARGVSTEAMDKAYALLSDSKAKRGASAGAEAVEAKLVELLGPDVASRVTRADALYRQSLRTRGPVLSGAPTLDSRPYRVVPGKGSVQ